MAKQKRKKKWLLILLLLGAGYYFFFYEHTPELLTGEVQKITLENFAQNEKTVLVDTRPIEKFKADSHARSVNVRDSEFNQDFLKFLSAQIPGYTIIVYGDIGSGDPVMVARRLQNKGVSNVFVYEGGYETLRNNITY